MPLDFQSFDNDTNEYLTKLRAHRAQHDDQFVVDMIDDIIDCIKMRRVCIDEAVNDK